MSNPDSSVMIPRSVASTISGAVWSEDHWSALFAWANAILVVVDPQRSRYGQTQHLLALARSHIRRLTSALQVTKSDLIERSAGTCFTAYEITTTYDLPEEIPLFVSTLARPQSLVAGVEYLRTGSL